MLQHVVFAEQEPTDTVPLNMYYVDKTLHDCNADKTESYPFPITILEGTKLHFQSQGSLSLPQGLAFSRKLDFGVEYVERDIGSVSCVVEHITTTYKQYKSDTDRFATWLVNVATKCGYKPADLDAKSTSTKASSNKKSASKGASPQYAATLPEMRNMADAVADANIRVPASILAIGERAVELRKKVTSYFLGLGNSGSNDRHAHFIEQLDAICFTLSLNSKQTVDVFTGKDPGNGPRMRVNTPGEREDDSDTQAWVNRFSALTLEDVEDAPEKAPSNEIIIVEVVEYAEDAEEDEEDFLTHSFFRLFCLFHDLHTWREFLSKTWSEYNEMKIDLMTASIVTDSAMQLARDLIQDAFDSLPSGFLSDDVEAQMLVYGTSCAARGVPDLPSSELGLPFNVRMAKVADWCFIGPKSLLHSFVPILKKNHVPVYKPEYFGVYDPKADRSKMSVAQKFNQDKILLLEVLPEFAMIQSYNVPLPVRDEITAGFVDYIKTKKPTLWLCFAAQVMLDATHAMASSRLGPFGDLRMSGLRIAKTIDEYHKLVATHAKPQFWPKEGDEEIKRIREAIERFIEVDLFKMMRQGLAPAGNKARTETGRSQLLFNRNPALSGAVMFHLNLRMQRIGQSLITQWYDVQQMAFLYNLVQQTPGQQLSWPDMETFIKIHGEEFIFIGDRPKDAEQSFNRLKIASGISSVTRMAKDSRKKGSWHHPDGKNARIIESTTKFANVFRQRYEAEGSSGSKSRSFYSAEMKNLLDELSEKSAAAAKSNSKANKDRQVGSSLSPQQLLEQKWQSTHKIGALQLLAMIKEKLCEEEPVLMFNYFVMHKHTLDILRRIRAKEHEKFVQCFTEQYMPDETFISNLVLLIHHVAQGSAKDSEHLGLAKSVGGQHYSRMVVSCGDVMREYLDKNGDAIVKSLRTFCKNKTQIFDPENDGAGHNKEADERFMYWLKMEELLSPAQMESLKTGIPLA